ncbi:MAG: ATP synthase subunit C [Anaerofustis sp.]
MYHFIITFAFIVVLATVGSGILMIKSPAGIKLPSGKTLTYTSVAMSMILLAMFIVTFAPGAVKAATDIGSGNGLAYIAAGISTGLACLGAGFAVASVGAAALGALTEDPKIMGKTLIFVGLAEGIAIYGLIISIMIITAL